ncbi:putative RNase H-like HicB family nuclease [Clostridium beijerinckii]|uniref:type II toxin-antitoxin system HicB family antitoxin n=1 Tax=Clostridium beijerinckii TaxID=1520 RepID=UPI00156F9BB0|nr:type II toxin-antitoxin system HicB family antitoxin [Clostridium beijerinckii]NRT32459.1 putative RNase H-like HicB family nuclease [Clostridium beijerinckii]NRT48113.1 putative RNase H-like HicB family nuclease [Clostridium beijerinckii]NRZ23590.1 putative RNase H-like HicB family nuclease [Clostridium beijerinckii]
MDKYLYFATFTPCEEGGYTITFIDLEGCITECDDIEEGMRNAKEALELHLFGMEDDGDEIPKTTEPQNIKLNKGQFLVPIKVYMKPVREEMNNKAVKKTLTIPYWLNKIAEQEKINFSALLQTAIKEKLDINNK